MKNYDINKNSPYTQYQEINSQKILQKLPVNNLEWIKDTCRFNEDFIKNFNPEGVEGYFLEVDVQYLKKYQELHKDFQYLPEKIKIEKVKKLVAKH